MNHSGYPYGCPVQNTHSFIHFTLTLEYQDFALQNAELYCTVERHIAGSYLTKSWDLDHTTRLAAVLRYHKWDWHCLWTVVTP